MTDCQRLRVVFAGTPDFAAVALQALIDSCHDVVGVLSQPDRPSGRGRKLTPSAVKALAQQFDIPVQQPVNFKSSDSVAELATFDADVIVVAAYGLLLPESVLRLPPLGCLNIHASLLPRWRGAAPIHRAILAGDLQTGVCIMQMDSGLDTGDVLHQTQVPIDENMTSGELHDVLAQIGADALVDTLTPRCLGNIKPLPQPEAGTTYAAKLEKSEAVLDWKLPAKELHRKIMAFNPWPVAETRLDDERVRIWRSRMVADVKNDAVPGTVVGVVDGAIRIASGDGLLDLIELQRPGKKPIAANDFCRGVDVQHKLFG